MRRRWADTIQQDPAYSPNLTLDYEDFTYARQPRTMNFNNTQRESHDRIIFLEVKLRAIITANKTLDILTK